MAEVGVGRALRDGREEGEYAVAVSIRDALACPLGSQIFRHFLCNLASNISSGKASSRGLVLVALDRSPSFYLDLLKAGESRVTWIRVLDCYSDPLGWKSLDEDCGDELRRNFADPKNIHGLISLVLDQGKEMAGEGKDRFAVAIDSISTLLRHNPLASVARLISDLRSHGHVSSMMWMVRSDLHDPRTCAALDYLSTMVAILEPEMDKHGSDSYHHGGRLHLRMKRRNGRLKIMNEEFVVNARGVKFLDPSTEIKITRHHNPLPKLQFNLQLSEKERMDKERVVLPFEHQGDGKKVDIYDGRRSTMESGMDDSMTKSGAIHYIRDSDDEHPDSDEDPDVMISTYDDLHLHMIMILHIKKGLYMILNN